MKKAFTLIEMLVVVAIIGILATAVIISIGPARTQARDARIRGDVEQLRNLAETYFNQNNFSYLGFSCSTIIGGTSAQTLCNDISTQNGGVAPQIVATQVNVCISAKLASGGYVCLDSTGKVTTSATTLTCNANGTCP